MLSHNTYPCITLIYGPMFSGKTTKLIELYKETLTKNKNCIAINYELDTRYGKNKISSHDGLAIDCYSITNLDDFIKNVILSQNSDLVSVFNKEFQWIKKRASECCRKMLSISFNFHTNESDIILIDSKVMNRDIKINLILDRKIK